jgi:hypothetical protein
MDMWNKFDNGSSIGQKGSEDGVIVLDEEHLDGIRITLERDGSIAPWSITCGIYGSFMHTAFASSEEKGRMKYDKMKLDLIELSGEDNDEIRFRKMDEFLKAY